LSCELQNPLMLLVFYKYAASRALRGLQAQSGSQPRASSAVFAAGACCIAPYTLQVYVEPPRICFFGMQGQAMIN
jgi:hypothetical protein